MAFSRELDIQVRAAFEADDLPGLKLALRRGHRCPGDHYISEAVHRGDVGLLRLLLERGCDGVDESCGGQSPLQQAMQLCMGDGDVGHGMVEMLLQHGAKANGDDAALDPPLHQACKRGNAAVVELLLKHRADPNAVSASGNTPLHSAAQHAAPYGSLLYQQVADQLLKHGACPQACDSIGLSASAYASEDVFRRKLIKAERWWSRRSLTLLSKGAPQEPGWEALPDVLPEALEAILSFTCTAGGAKC